MFKMFEDEKVLVAGGAGFIGTNVIKRPSRLSLSLIVIKMQKLFLIALSQR